MKKQQCEGCIAPLLCGQEYRDDASGRKEHRPCSRTMLPLPDKKPVVKVTGRRGKVTA